MHALSDPITPSTRALRLLRSAVDHLERSDDEALTGLSLQRALRALVIGNWGDAQAERARCDLNARMHAESNIPSAVLGMPSVQPREAHRAVFDLPWLQRALTGAAGSNGGYLPDVHTAAPVDRLFPFGLTGAAGMTVLEGLSGSSITIPPVRGNGVTTSWIEPNATNVPPVDPAFGAVSLTPKLLVGTVEVSRTLLRTAPRADMFLAAHLLRAASLRLDRAILRGAGGVEPLGLANMTDAVNGVPAVNGATLSHAHTREALRRIGSANAADASTMWVTTPEVRELMQAREVVATTGRFLCEDDRVLNRPLRATPEAPAATIVGGDWSASLVGLWGAGIEVEVNPFHNFNANMIAMRVLLAADFAPLHPSAFVRITNVS